MTDERELAPEPIVVRRRLQIAHFSIGSYRNSPLCLNITGATVMHPNYRSRPRNYHLELDHNQLHLLKACIEEELNDE